MAELYDVQASVQYGQDAAYYINGLGISNDATTPNTILNVAPGSCLDSTGTFQFNSNVVLSLNTALIGLGGLDTGTIAASTMYAVYAVWDAVHNKPAGIMLSLSLTQPYLPFAYGQFLLIGFVTIDSSSHIVKGYWSAGNSSTREFTYDVNQVTAVTAGTSSTLANVNLIAVVPNVNNTPVQILSSFVPAAANDVLVLQSGLSDAAGTQGIVVGQVAAVTVTTGMKILAQTVVLSSISSPVVNYKITGGTVAIDVYGYTWYV